MRTQIRRATQAYRELPWRKQVRWLMWALAAAVAVAAVIALEVHLSAEAVLLDYRIDELREATLQQQHEIVAMQTNLAVAHSVAALQQWASENGYKMLDPAHVHFVPVPADAVVSPEVQPVRVRELRPVEVTPLPEEYTVSLLRLLSRYLLLEPAR